MANGVLESNTTSGGKTTWVWNETDPMAPVPGDEHDRQVRPDDLDDREHPVVPRDRPAAPTGNVFRLMPEIVRFYESIYGPYPFNAVGGIADSAKNVGYSLETQTKPVYDRMPDELDASPTSSRTCGSATRSR